MSLGHGVSTVKSGLVLHFDAANLRSKSYNLITNPENLSGLLGLRSGAIITTNATTAPDGTITADLITGTGSGFGYYFPTWPVGNATHSWFIKPNGATTTFTFNHVGTATGGTFNFTTKQFSSLVNYTGTYEELSNGWYLVKFHTTNESNNYYVELSFNSNDGAYIWGTQLIPFSYYRRYIPQNSGVLSATNNSTWYDLSGSNNGSILNGAYFDRLAEGSIGFDGVDDYVSCGTFSLSYITVSTWVYKTSSATHQGICRKQFGWAVSQYSGTLQVAPGNNWAFYNTGYTIPLNTWTCIDYTYDGTNQTVFINGNNIWSSALSGSFPTNSNAVRVGYDDNGWWWGGKISNVKLYNRALTAAEIKQNFEALRGRYGI
jgi:Concanavalin A-like lectin/glucanases superfamily